ncbi:MAG: P-type conjugative transfer protein TrbL [Synergistaceae bacterium]|jgi:P-type conjugative transfer protein TrbL|nr:P-type conjugative transfer protein TrbL [Synergistaceae bacterium]
MEKSEYAGTILTVFTLAAVLSLTVAVAPSSAAAPSTADGSAAVDYFITNIDDNMDKLRNVFITGASIMFFTLATIQLAWAGMNLLFRGDFSIQSFFGALVKEMLFIGFFYWLLTQEPDLGQWIVTGLRNMVGEATGFDNISPASLFSTGIEIIYKLTVAAFRLGVHSAVWAVVPYAMSLAALAFSAAFAAVYLVEFYVAVPFGVIFLGMGGSLWSKKFTENYVRVLISIALKLTTLQIVLGIVMSMMTSINTTISDIATVGGDGFFIHAFNLAGLSVLTFLAVKNIPSFAASLVANAWFQSSLPMLAAASPHHAGVDLRDAYSRQSDDMIAIGENSSSPGHSSFAEQIGEISMASDSFSRAGSPGAGMEAGGFQTGEVTDSASGGGLRYETPNAPIVSPGPVSSDSGARVSGGDAMPERVPGELSNIASRISGADAGMDSSRADASAGMAASRDGPGQSRDGTTGGVPAPGAIAAGGELPYIAPGMPDAAARQVESAQGGTMSSGSLGYGVPRSDGRSDRGRPDRSGQSAEVSSSSAGESSESSGSPAAPPSPGAIAAGGELPYIAPGMSKAAARQVESAQGGTMPAGSPEYGVPGSDGRSDRGRLDRSGQSAEVSSSSAGESSESSGSPAAAPGEAADGGLSNVASAASEIASRMPGTRAGSSRDGEAPPERISDSASSGFAPSGGAASAPDRAGTGSAGRHKDAASGVGGEGLSNAASGISEIAARLEGAGDGPARSGRSDTGAPGGHLGAPEARVPATSFGGLQQKQMDPRALEALSAVMRDAIRNGMASSESTLGKAVRNEAMPVDSFQKQASGMPPLQRSVFRGMTNQGQKSDS